MERSSHMDWGLIRYSSEIKNILRCYPSHEGGIYRLMFSPLVWR